MGLVCQWRAARCTSVTVIARAALFLTGISREHLGELIAELAGPWEALTESRLRERRGGERKRAAGAGAGAGAGHTLVVTDRVLAALVVLRFQLPHKAVGLLFGVSRSTVDRAVADQRTATCHGLL